MSKILEYYKNRFAHLIVSKSRKDWTEMTNFGAPHKPFLLFSLMDLMAQGNIQTNFIELNMDLLDVFAFYWEKIAPNNKKKSIVYPFYHLQSGDFWTLITLPGKEQVLREGGAISSMKQMREIVAGGKFVPELFDLLQVENTRNELRRVLIETYFAPSIRQTLVEIGQITQESFIYSQELKGKSHQPFDLIKEVPTVQYQYRLEVRSAAFRRIVTEAYKHTCVICRLRLLTPEGHTAVSAAHIVPWSESHNDDPRNGITLCGVHHWIFDEGLLSIKQNYKIIVSPLVSMKDNTSDNVLSFNNQLIFLPENDALWPAQEALQWHRQNVYRTE